MSCIFTIKRGGYSSEKERNTIIFSTFLFEFEKNFCPLYITVFFHRFTKGDSLLKDNGIRTNHLFVRVYDFNMKITKI